jgi:hypothetical protein
MRKANATIYAAAALGLCLMSPQGAAASPAMPDMGKTYTQAAKGENLVLARFVRGRAAGVGRVGRFGAVGVRHYGLGRGLGYGYGRRAYLGGRGLRGGYYGLGRGLGYGYGRRAYWGGGGGYYGGWGPEYGLGLGWGWPLGLGLGLGVAATDWGLGAGWGYPSYDGGAYPAYYGGGGCAW